MKLKGKKIVVTGGTGMVGQALLKKLVELEPYGIISVSMDDRHFIESDLIEYEKADLRDARIAKALINGDILFHLAGIKGSPQLTRDKPYSFLVPMLQFNTNVISAAINNNLEYILYTSSVGVYAPAEVFEESQMWLGVPSLNDRDAGYAKRVGELQLMAYGKEYDRRNFSIVRPVNIFGPGDNFNPNTAMVIPSLIAKAVALEDGEALEVWGDGSPIRDFIYSEDVALGMIKCVEKEVNDAINLGSGLRISIRELVDTICDILKNDYNKSIGVSWLIDKPMGDAVRVASTTLAESYGISARTDLYEGLSLTIAWYMRNKDALKERYDVFV